MRQLLKNATFTANCGSTDVGDKGGKTVIMDTADYKNIVNYF